MNSNQPCLQPLESDTATSLRSIRSGISSNRIQGIMRLKQEADGIGPLRLSQPEHGKVFQKICKEIESGTTSTRNLLLTTGFGMHASCTFPARLPALIIPGLHVLEQCKDSGLEPPQYVLYQATQFLTRANKLPVNEAEVCAKRMEQYLRAYIDRFHADIAHYVTLRFNCDHAAETSENIEHMMEMIRQKSLGDTDIHPILKQLEVCEVKYAGKQPNSLSYAAANVIYSGAIRSLYPFRELMLPQKIEALLPIGGRAEKPFFTLTSRMSDSVTIPFITHLGIAPTYYPYPSDNDPLIPSDIPSAKTNGPITADLTAMKNDGATVENLMDIYPPLP